MHRHDSQKTDNNCNDQDRLMSFHGKPSTIRIPVALDIANPFCRLLTPPPPFLPADI